MKTLHVTPLVTCPRRRNPMFVKAIVDCALPFLIASPSSAGDLMERAKRAPPRPFHGMTWALRYTTADPLWGPDAKKVVAGLKMLEKPAPEPAAPFLDTGWTADEIRPLLKHEDTQGADAGVGCALRSGAR